MKLLTIFMALCVVSLCNAFPECTIFGGCDSDSHCYQGHCQRNPTRGSQCIPAWLGLTDHCMDSSCICSGSSGAACAASELLGGIGDALSGGYDHQTAVEKCCRCVAN